jgi:phospholipid transport system substrate-binding protein
MSIRWLKSRLPAGTKHWLFLLGLCVLCAPSQASDTSDPRELVDATIETLRANVIHDEALLEGDPGHALMLVESIVAPHIDMQLASRLILGKHWQAATPAQREAFVGGLRGLLLRIVAIHVRDYSSAVVIYEPTVLGGKDNQHAMVRTEVSRDGIPPVSVDYRLHHAHGAWKIYDVSILGISLVKTYRITLAGELKRYGLDGVIEQINAKSPIIEAGSVRFAEPSPTG